MTDISGSNVFLILSHVFQFAMKKICR